MKSLLNRNLLNASSPETNLESRVMLAGTPTISQGELSITRANDPTFVSRSTFSGRTSPGGSIVINGINTASTGDPAEFAQVGLDLRAQNGGTSNGRSTVVLDETGRDGDVNLDLVADAAPGGAAFSTGISQIGLPPTRVIINRIVFDNSFGF